MAWLKRGLLNSAATRNWGVEAVAQGDNGPPRGRELEVAVDVSFPGRY
jgi:hypothetical protein